MAYRWYTPERVPLSYADRGGYAPVQSTTWVAQPNTTVGWESWTVIMHETYSPRTPQLHATAHEPYSPRNPQLHTNQRNRA
jgi:hypothetical protein